MAYIGAGISRFNTADELTVTGDAQIDGTTLVIDSTNNRVGVGTASPATALDVTGVITTDGMTTSADITFGDNDKAVFGAGSDLEIYHNGANSFIHDNGTGELILGSNSSVRINKNLAQESIAIFNADGAVELYYDNAKKIETTSAGVDVTGNATFDDNGKAIFGAGNDLQIFHDGSNSHILDAGTGSLVLRSPFASIKNQTNTETMASFSANGAVNLFYDNAKKLETTSTGVDVTGVITTDGMTTSADINFGDNDKAVFGAGNDLQIYHNGSHSRIEDAGTGKLQLGSDTEVEILKSGFAESMAKFIPDGAVELYHNNSKKIETTSTGVDVTGTITFDGGTTSADLNFGDSDKAIFGAGNDLQIYHDGTHSYVQDAGTGDLRISGNNVNIMNGAATENYIVCTNNGSVAVKHDNATKLETASGGISVTGNIAVTGTVDGRDVATDGTKLDGIEASADVTDTTNVVAALTAGTNVTIAADGTISSTDTNTTYTAGGDYGMTLSGTEFRLENDRRRNSTSTDIYSGNTHDYTFYDANIGIRWYTAGAEEMRLLDNGNLHVDGNVTAYSTTVSDPRLKKDIQPVTDALARVEKLNGYTFTYKHDGSASAGVLSTELTDVLPSAIKKSKVPLVAGDDNDIEYDIVQYDQLHALLIEAVKELSARVKELENDASK